MLSNQPWVPALVCPRHNQNSTRHDINVYIKCVMAARNYNPIYTIMIKKCTYPVGKSNADADRKGRRRDARGIGNVTARKTTKYKYCVVMGITWKNLSLWRIKWSAHGKCTHTTSIL